MAVGISVSVGSEVGNGSGVDVEAGMSVATGSEVGLAPQALAINDKTINRDEYDTNFVIGISSCYADGSISTVALANVAFNLLEKV